MVRNRAKITINTGIRIPNKQNQKPKNPKTELSALSRPNARAFSFIVQQRTAKLSAIQRTTIQGAKDANIILVPSRYRGAVEKINGCIDVRAIWAHWIAPSYIVKILFFEPNSAPITIGASFHFVFLCFCSGLLGSCEIWPFLPQIRNFWIPWLAQWSGIGQRL